VIVPIDEGIDSKDIVYRIGEDPMDPMRGPTVELGYRVKDAIGGRYKETLLVDGQILNAINKQDTFWTLDEMGGCKVILLTLTRPSMMRFRHDPVLKRKTEEERIEPQTWDALLVDERIKPKITQTMFFDIALEGEPAGRIELGLFGDLLPKTVKNFAGLCTGEYVDDEGKAQKSAHCFKKTKFGSIMPNFLMSAGNPGKDIELVSFSQEELKEYLSFFEDFRREPVKVGKVERNWAIRWGSDLGTGEDADGNLRKEGGAVDGNSDKELQEIVEIMRTLVEKGNGASIFFFKPEWEKGCDMMGATFPAEGFMVPHAKRGMLSMDRSDTKDFQGSNFFITLKEFPHMDKRMKRLHCEALPDFSYAIYSATKFGHRGFLAGAELGMLSELITSFGGMECGTQRAVSESSDCTESSFDGISPATEYPKTRNVATCLCTQITTVGSSPDMIVDRSITQAASAHQDSSRFQKEQEACPRVTARIEAFELVNLFIIFEKRVLGIACTCHFAMQVAQCSEISSAESVAAVLLKGIESSSRVARVRNPQLTSEAANQISHAAKLQRAMWCPGDHKRAASFSGGGLVSSLESTHVILIKFDLHVYTCHVLPRQPAVLPSTLSLGQLPAKLICAVIVLFQLAPTVRLASQLREMKQKCLTAALLFQLVSLSEFLPASRLRLVFMLDTSTPAASPSPRVVLQLLVSGAADTPMTQNCRFKAARLFLQTTLQCAGWSVYLRIMSPSNLYIESGLKKIVPNASSSKAAGVKAGTDIRIGDDTPLPVIHVVGEFWADQAWLSQETDTHQVNIGDCKLLCTASLAFFQSVQGIDIPIGWSLEYFRSIVEKRILVFGGDTALGLYAARVAYAQCAMVLLVGKNTTALATSLDVVSNEVVPSGTCSPGVSAKVSSVMGDPNDNDFVLLLTDRYDSALGGPPEIVWNFVGTPSTR
ncbi:unnamed protein product, partial [Polarella glacialis]